MAREVAEVVAFRPWAYRTQMRQAIARETSFLVSSAREHDQMLLVKRQMRAWSPLHEEVMIEMLVQIFGLLRQRIRPGLVLAVDASVEDASIVAVVAAPIARPLEAMVADLSCVVCVV